MTDPASTATAPARLSLGEAAAAYEAAVDAGPRRGLGRPGCSIATRRCGRATSASRPTIAERLGWLDAPAHFTDQTAGARGLRRRASSRTGFTTVVVAGHGRQQPRARTSSIARSGRQDGYPDLRILDSTDPAVVAATLDDLDPLRTLIDHREQVGHDDRAERVPRRRLGARRRGARRDQAPPVRGPGRASSPRSPTPARASTRSPTTTTSARSSSTRPTSAAATRR